MEKYTVLVENDVIMWLKEGTQILHRLDGPAFEYSDGRKEWLKNGERHREDGPAVECANGNKEYWLNGKLHRLDGPAIECLDGRKEWYLYGKLHREDGPAKEFPSGKKEYWINGLKFSEKELISIGLIRKIELNLIKRNELDFFKNKIINDLLEEISERADEIFVSCRDIAIGKAFDEIVCKYANKK